MSRNRAKAEPRTAQVVDLSHDGRGVCRDADGKTVFVPDALPGESILYQPRRRRRRFDEGELLEVLTPGPDRVEPRCAAFGYCGGCSLQHLAPAPQLAAKQKHLAEVLQRIGGVTPQRWLAPLTGPLWGYRRRARLAAKWVAKKERVLVGFRERGKPYVADIDACEVLDPRVGRRLDELAALIQGLAARESIPQIEVAAGDADVALVFRHLEPLGDADLARLAAFDRQHTDLWVHLQPGGLDTVAPLDPAAPTLNYALPEEDVDLDFTPVDFIQVNTELNRRMVGQALDLLELSPGERVLELFAGLGNFTLPLARRGARVTAVEGEAALVERGRANAERHGLTANYHVADLFEPQTGAPWLRAGCDKLLLDPPRAGAEAILPAVLAGRPQRIVYVSCHPASLARDARLIEDAGYRLTEAGVMDMFPHTGHVESIAAFSPA